MEKNIKSPRRGKTIEIDIEKVSHSFSWYLRNWLTVDQLKEVNRKNETEEYIQNRYCASHEYCDPNEAMIQAMEGNGFKFDTQSEEQNKVIKEAWNLSKKLKFAN